LKNWTHGKAIKHLLFYGTVQGLTSVTDKLATKLLHHSIPVQLFQKRCILSNDSGTGHYQLPYMLNDKIR